MNQADKLKSFEYLSHEFFRWFSEVSPGTHVEENFSKLKLIKLHFFACAATSNPQEKGLLSLFDNFFAMPYGHVESSVYESLSDIKTISFGKSHISINQIPEGYFDDLDKGQLDDAIESLKKRNKNIVTYSPMELVDLSHSWNSWMTMYNLARRFNKFSMKIPSQMIQNENKIFILN